jgi:hypothetical protein
MDITRYWVRHKAATSAMSTGFTDLDEAKKHAEWMANTYGGVAQVTSNDLAFRGLAFSAARGWRGQ